jgi:formylmethanofuran dehydrogenase subunit D
MLHSFPTRRSSDLSRLAPSHVGVTRALLADPRHRDGVVPPLRGGLDAGRERASRATATDANVGATEEEPSQIDPMATPGLQETEAHAVAVTAVRPIGPGDLGQAGGDGDQGRPALLELEAPEEPPLPPVDAYSLRLIATRTLYGDGTLVQRSPSLAPLAPAPTARLNPYDLERLGSSDRTRVGLRSRRGSVVVEAVADAGVPKGSLWLPFNAVGEGAADLIDADAPVTEVRVESP